MPHLVPDLAKLNKDLHYKSVFIFNSAFQSCIFSKLLSFLSNVYNWKSFFSFTCYFCHTARNYLIKYQHNCLKMLSRFLKYLFLEFIYSLHVITSYYVELYDQFLIHLYIFTNIFILLSMSF